MEQNMPNDAEMIVLPSSSPQELADGEHLIHTTADQVRLWGTASGGQFVAWRLTDSQGNQFATQLTRFTVCCIGLEWDTPTGKPPNPGEQGRCRRYRVVPCYLIAN